ncbi:MAG: tetratricopeptide repeat protein [Desulfuromonadales bacterium]|nr:tetratricopeptide repeat protein [Desulfuromonadales bacterium]
MNRPAFAIWLLTTFVALILSGCAGTPAPPQRSAEDLRLSAESHITDRQFSAAAAELAAAIKLAPDDADHALRYGEILEVLSRWQDARTHYQKGLEHLPPEHPRRNEFIYRLSLLALFKLDDPETAKQLSQQLSENSAAYYDIQGVLTARDGDMRDALRFFNRGLAAQPSKEVAARILQHATTAYVRLDQIPAAFGTLFNAINLAGRKPALEKEIEADWSALKEKYGEY